MEFTGERYIPNSTENKELEIEHVQRYNSIIDLVKDKIVLDAACGEGYGAYILSKYAKKVYAFDISEETIAHAKLTYSKPNLCFFKGSVDSIDIPNDSIDIIVSFETIEHISEEQQSNFLEEAKRILKNNGLFIVSTPDKYWYSDYPKYSNPFHVKEFYKSEFYSFLSGYFSHVQFYYQRYEVVSLISNKNVESLKEINLDGNEKGLSEGKYIIAICSDSSDFDINHIDIHSVIIRGDQYYQKMVDRIITLQEEVEERNLHIKNLDEHIDDLKVQLSVMNDHNNQLIVQNNTLVDRNNQLIDHNNKLIDQSIKIKDQIIDLSNNNSKLQYLNRELEKHNKQMEDDFSKAQEEVEQKMESVRQKLKESVQKKEQEIINLSAHIEQLLEQERKLYNILHSGGWKFLLKYYKIRDFIIPPNSKRKLIAKLFIKTLKNPKRMISSLNRNNFKKIMYYLKTENAGMVINRVDNYVDRHKEHQKAEIKLIEQRNEYEELTFPIIENPLVSIVIPVYNQWNYTYSCLRSILDNTKGIEYEIIIADDVSTDETVNIQKYIKNVIVIRDEVNRGFLLNCNNAAEKARGKYILFLNNDTNVQSNWLKALVETIENDHSVGMVGSKLVYPDGRQQEAGGIIWNDASGWNYGRLDDPDKPEYNYVKEVDYISGAAIMIRADLWKQIGGFDERYVPAYYEDSDLAFEVRRHGYKVVFQPKSVVVHFEGISHGTDTSTGIKSYQLENKNKFLDKWKAVLKSDHFENATNVFWARDRSRNKKTILVVDHYVPHYDKDAGGRCVYQYIKLYKQLGLHVIFIGDNFYKHEPYTSELEQLGIEVLYGNWYATNVKNWIINHSKYIDYVYLNRPHISIKYIDTIKKYTSAKVIYFGHDLHYLREERNYQISGNAELLKSSESWKKLEFELFNKADIIHVVGSYEKEIIESQFPNKTVRNIPLYIFEDTKIETAGFEERTGLLFVGGFNHKPNYDAMIWFVNHIFPSVLEELPSTKLYIVGSNPPDDIVRLNSEHIVVTGFVTDEELNKYYSSCRVVVVPLRYGAGVKGKVVEALYHQVPIITTSIGAEGLTDIHELAKITDDEREFVNMIIQLYQDKHEWEKVSQQSKRYIEQNFSVFSAIKQIEKDIIVGE